MILTDQECTGDDGGFLGERCDPRRTTTDRTELVSVVPTIVRKYGVALACWVSVCASTSRIRALRNDYRIGEVCLKQK
jgi:hypothetical protein